MKTALLFLLVCLLATSWPRPVRADTYCGDCGGGAYWAVPLFLFGIGLGVAAAASSEPRTEVVYTSPAYLYAPPVAYSPPGSPPGKVHAIESAPAPVASPVWVPITPGAGRWVPDPKPYAYVPAAATPARTTQAGPARRTVSMKTSAGGIPVYVNN